MAYIEYGIQFITQKLQGFVEEIIDTRMAAKETLEEEKKKLEFEEKEQLLRDEKTIFNQNKAIRNAIETNKQQAAEQKSIKKKILKMRCIVSERELRVMHACNFVDMQVEHLGKHDCERCHDATDTHTCLNAHHKMKDCSYMPTLKEWDGEAECIKLEAEIEVIKKRLAEREGQST
ncbi:unnamed protein product [Owenia fusiformis]|uniref:Uncharacterized protein n=1 Tax=Owenia fusiformis TaxID=6347 RepID=A0A8S4Q838_OWEFU|nr:unnamed protein product [Owenia fusiformis]